METTGTRSTKKDYNKSYYRKHRSRIIEQAKKRNAKPEARTRAKSRSKHYSLMYNFGISLDRWYEIIDIQDGCCAICGRKLKLTGKPTNLTPQVDHCHFSGKIRGILCRPCNMNVVPHFERHPERIDNLKSYLNKEDHYGIVPGHKEDNDTTPSNS